MAASIEVVAAFKRLMSCCSIAVIAVVVAVAAGLLSVKGIFAHKVEGSNTFYTLWRMVGQR